MWGRFALLGAAIGLVGSSALAQTAPPPVAPSASVPPAEQTIGLGEAQQRMTVPVLIADKGPFAFIIDTGAERSVVSQELAQSLRLDPGRNARLFDFTGVSAVGTVKVPSLSISSLDSLAMEAPSLAMANIGALGMLGIDALQGQKVTLDFNHKRMTLKPSKHHLSGEFIVHAKDHVGQLIVTDAFFNGQPIAVVIDTGSEISIGNSAMRALTKHAPRQLGPITITSVTGRSFKASYVMIRNLEIGGVRFDNVPLAFVDVPPFERFGLRDTPALILGMSSLELFQRVELDFANREVAFTLPRPSIDFHSVCREYSNCTRR